MEAPIFDAYGHYYDFLYRDKDYVGEASYIHDLLKRYEIAGGNLLEFGSGTGKHGCLLADLGYVVHGIERSAEMVERARKTKGFTCQQGDITITGTNQKFDVVLSLFHVISYLTTNNQLHSVFSNASKHLNKNGLFVFDFWYSPAVYAQKPSVRIKRMMDEKFQITRIAEPTIFPNDNRVDVNYTIFSKDLVDGRLQIITETHPMRHFSLPEIDLLAASHDFERIGAEEFMSGKLAGEDTWGVCVILRKVA
jgi:SAM-dependent methyltransferase